MIRNQTTDLFFPIHLQFCIPTFLDKFRKGSVVVSMDWWNLVTFKFGCEILLRGWKEIFSRNNSLNKAHNKNKRGNSWSFFWFFYTKIILNSVSDFPKGKGFSRYYDEELFIWMPSMSKSTNCETSTFSSLIMKTKIWNWLSLKVSITFEIWTWNLSKARIPRG